MQVVVVVGSLLRATDVERSDGFGLLLATFHVLNLFLVVSEVEANSSGVVQSQLRVRALTDADVGLAVPHVDHAVLCGLAFYCLNLPQVCCIGLLCAPCQPICHVAVATHCACRVESLLGSCNLRRGYILNVASSYITFVALYQAVLCISSVSLFLSVESGVVLGGVPVQTAVEGIVTGLNACHSQRHLVLNHVVPSGSIAVVECLQLNFCGVQCLNSLHASSFSFHHELLNLCVESQECLYVLGTVVAGLVAYVLASNQLIDNCTVALAGDSGVVSEKSIKCLLILVSLAKNLYFEDLPDLIATNFFLCGPAFAFTSNLTFSPEYYIGTGTVVVDALSHVVGIPSETAQSAGNAADSGMVEVILTSLASEVLVVGAGSFAWSVCHPLACTELDVVNVGLTFYGNETNQHLEVIVRTYALFSEKLVNLRGSSKNNTLCVVINQTTL